MYRDTQAWSCRHRIGIFSFNRNYLHEESDISKLPVEGMEVYHPALQNTEPLEKCHWLKLFHPDTGGTNINIQKGCNTLDSCSCILKYNVVMNVLLASTMKTLGAYIAQLKTAIVRHDVSLLWFHVPWRGTHKAKEKGIYKTAMPSLL